MENECTHPDGCAVIYLMETVSEHELTLAASRTTHKNEKDPELKLIIAKHRKDLFKLRDRFIVKACLNACLNCPLIND